MAQPSSFLHWLRRVLAARKDHPVFGVGSFDVVPSGNDHVLAFLRTDTRDRLPEDRSARTVLCVNNLASTAQGASLQLPAEYAGARVRDVIGGAVFNVVGDDGTVPVTLGDRGWFWLALETEDDRG